jgi:hypothetical protein
MQKTFNAKTQRREAAKISEILILLRCVTMGLSSMPAGLAAWLLGVEFGLNHSGLGGSIQPSFFVFHAFSGGQFDCAIQD